MFRARLSDCNHCVFTTSTRTRENGSIRTPVDGWTVRAVSFVYCVRPFFALASSQVLLPSLFIDQSTTLEITSRESSRHVVYGRLYETKRTLHKSRFKGPRVLATAARFLKPSRLATASFARPISRIPRESTRTDLARFTSASSASVGIVSFF